MSSFPPSILCDLGNIYYSVVSTINFLHTNSLFHFLSLQRRGSIICRHCYRKEHLSHSFTLDYGKNYACCSLQCNIQSWDIIFKQVRKCSIHGTWRERSRSLVAVSFGLFFGIFGMKETLDASIISPLTSLILRPFVSVQNTASWWISLYTKLF